MVKCGICFSRLSAPTYILLFIQRAEEYRELYQKYLEKLSPEEREKAAEMDGWNKHKKSEKAATKTDTSGSPEVRPVIHQSCSYQSVLVKRANVVVPKIKYL